MPVVRKWRTIINIFFPVQTPSILKDKLPTLRARLEASDFCRADPVARATEFMIYGVFSLKPAPQRMQRFMCFKSLVDTVFFSPHLGHTSRTPPTCLIAAIRDEC
jgi:hypothetical protein